MTTDCEYTDEIICPHCGAEKEDEEIFDGLEGEEEVTCDRCGEEFVVSRTATFSYSTCPADTSEVKAEKARKELERNRELIREMEEYRRVKGEAV